jgi:tRNA(adenine34) deaminase
MNHYHFMKLAYEESLNALCTDEVPVGAVIVNKFGEVLSQAHNRVEKNMHVVSHAEILAIQEASKRISNWRLSDTTLYVTLEPCIMCIGAIYLSGIQSVIFGCKNKRLGACGSLVDLSEISHPYNKVKFESYTGYPLCSLTLTAFFRMQRIKIDSK